jgi:hypothetical protein
VTAWLWVLLASCGGSNSDFCERLDAARARCDEASPSPEAQAACTDSLKDCSNADLSLLDDYVSCLEEVDCTTVAVGFYDCAAMLVDLQDPSCGS